MRPPGPPRTRRRAVIRAALIVLLVPIILVGLALAALQIAAVSTPLANTLAMSLSPWEDATLSARRVDLSGIATLTLLDLRLKRRDGVVMSTVDTLSISLRPFELLQRKLRITRARVAGARVAMHQAADSTWDLLRPFTTPHTGAGKPITVRVDDVDIARSRVEAHYAGGDSALRVTDVAVRLAHFATTPLAVRVDTIGAKIYPPSRPSSAAMLTGALSIENDILVARDVELRSDSSRVFANGTLVLPHGDVREVSDIDFRLVAAPLDFRDVGPLVPGFDVAGSLRLTARVSGTAALISLVADGRAFDGSTFHAEGRLTPRARDSVRYELAASVRDFDGDLWRRRSPVGRIDAELAIDLGGRSLETVSGTLGVELGPVVINGRTVTPTELNATFHSGRATFTLASGLEPFGIDARGTVSPFDRRIPYDVDAVVTRTGDSIGTVRMAGAVTSRKGGALLTLDTAISERIDLAALTGNDSLRGLVAIEAKGSLPLGRVADARVDARVAVRGFAASGAIVDSARLGLRLLHGKLAAYGRAIAGRGFVVVDAMIQPFDSVPSWTVERATLTDVDLAAINTAWPASLLQSTLRASGRGFTAAALEADGELVAGASRIADRPIDSVATRFTVRDGVVTLGGNARALGGSGRFAADVIVNRNALPTIRGTLDLDPAAVRSGRIRGGTVAFYMKDSAARVDADIATERGRVTVTGTSRLARTDSGALTLVDAHATGRAHLPDIAALLGRDSVDGMLDATFRADADTLSTSAAVWNADVSAVARYGGARVDTLTLRANAANGVLQLDTLILRSNVATANGGGRLAYGRNATVPDNARLRAVLEADSASALDELPGFRESTLRGGSLVIDARNVNNGIDATARLIVRGLITPGMWVDSMIVDGSARIDSQRLARAHARIGAANAGYGAFDLQAIAGTVGYDTLTLDFDLALTGDNKQTAHFAGTSLPAKRSITFAQMDLYLGGYRWDLAEPSTVAWGAKTTVSDFVLQSGMRRVAVNGAVDREGTQDLTLALDSVPLQAFVAFTGLKGVDATAHGRLHLGGGARDVQLAGAMDVDMRGTSGRIELSPQPGSRLGVDASFVNATGQQMRIAGTAPLRLSLAPQDSTLPLMRGPLDLSVVADSFAIDWASPLAGAIGVGPVAGSVSASIRIGGTVDDPQTSGSATLERGAVSYVRHGVSYKNVTGTFVLDGDRIRVDSLRAMAGGTAVIDGNVVLESAARTQLDLRARFTRFHAAKNEWVDLVTSGNLNITGSLQAPEIDGSLEVINTDIFADPVGHSESGTPVELTPADYRMLLHYFGYRSRDVVDETAETPIDPWAMRIGLSIGANTWLRKRTTPEIAIQLDGSLDVRKQAGDSLQLFGTVQVLPERSTFEQFGRRFQVTTGNVVFNGAPTAWKADFDAEYAVPSPDDPQASEVTITLKVTGGSEDLALELGGSPAMETADVLSYLAVGRPAASATDFQGAGVVATGAALAAGQLASVIEQAATRNVGLDVVEVRQHGLKGATIVAGRYVNPRLFVGFEQPLTLQSDKQNETAVRQQSTEVQIAYRLYRWLVLSLEGGESNFRFLFRYRRAY